MKKTPIKALIPLVIWGASGHARVVADIVHLTEIFSIIGYLDDVNLSRKGADFCGEKILGGREQCKHLRDKKIRYLFLGIGDCQARLTLSCVAKQYGFELATLVHPRAVIANDVKVGAGTVIMAGAVVNAGSAIQENVIINTSSSVDHECIIHQGAHIGPGAHIGGGVTIGKGTWIGIGVIIKDRITIGKNSIIGAGSVVLRDIPDGVVAFGVPTQVVRKIDE